jgi:hypothetical protein
MDSAVSNELQNLFNQDMTTGTERTKILAICNTLVHDANLIAEIKNSITSVMEREGFDIQKNLGAVISCIISVFAKVEFYKTVSNERMKYVLYCLLISVLLKFYPTLLKNVEIAILRHLYDEVFDLVMIVPQTVVIAKQSCVSCIGKFRAFSFLNKGKHIIE